VAPALLLTGLARAERALRPAPEAPPGGPPNAALVWLHAHYTEGPPPSLPPFAEPLIGAGWDLWRLDRVGATDPLAAGAAALAAATARLRSEGYARIAVLGESRGAFIALDALGTPGLADAMLLLAPAAHGTRPERRPEALAAFRTACAATAPGALHRAGLVLFAGDPYDPDPAARAAAFRAAMRQCGIPALVLDRPAAPTGHGGARDPAFGASFGACLRGFLDTGGALPAQCAAQWRPP
jgi:hypothetical protein